MYPTPLPRLGQYDNYLKNNVIDGIEKSTENTLTTKLTIVLDRCMPVDNYSHKN
jgi:hypothetical protein